MTRRTDFSADLMARYAHVEEPLRPGGELWPVARNPTIDIHDLADGKVATTWKSHKNSADEIARIPGTPAGQLIAVVQRGRGRSWWCTEWTAVGHGEDRHASRRRAGKASSKSAAVAAMLEHPSFHSSHYFAPEEGLVGWYKRQ